MSEEQVLTEERSGHKQLVFRVGNQLYGAPLDDIIEVVEPCAITPSPNSPKEYLGLINLRGEIINVVDFRILVAQPQVQSPKMLMIIVQTTNGKVAVLADELIEVHDFPKDDLDFNPNLKTSIKKEALIGVGKYKDKIVYLLVFPELLGGSAQKVEAA